MFRVIVLINSVLRSMTTPSRDPETVHEVYPFLEKGEDESFCLRPNQNTHSDSLHVIKGLLSTTRDIPSASLAQPPDA
jgi:hypothetical protein